MREKKVAGRKRTLLVDTTGLVLRVLVHPADIQDSEGAEWLLANFRRDFPDLKLIASHFGAWEDWDEVEEHLIGRRVYLDTSYSIAQLGRERALSMLERHDNNYFLFGSDSPWGDQSEDLKTLRELGLDDRYIHRILGGNAAKLLNLA